MSTIGRRHFLKHSALGLGLGVGWSTLQPASAAPAPQASPLSSARADDSVLLFQGDSITDTGRNREDSAPNQPHALGSGYVALAASELMGSRPDSDWACYNRGIGGDKVEDLAARWEEDTLALEPDVLSILVGVNDFWHTLSGPHDGTPERYEQSYRALLDRTLDALPDVTLLLGEPFALSGGSAVDERWRPDFLDSVPVGLRRGAPEGPGSLLVGRRRPPHPGRPLPDGAGLARRLPNRTVTVCVNANPTNACVFPSRPSFYNAVAVPPRTSRSSPARARRRIWRGPRVRPQYGPV